MSKIICAAYFLVNDYDLKYQCACPIAVSASFQSALTPWLVTLAAEQNSSVWSVHELKSLSLSPTFQFTRSLSVFLQSDDDQAQFMKGDLCAPLFSHLQELYIGYRSVVVTAADGRRTKMRNKFDNGAEVADFALKFGRLQKIDMYFEAASDQTSPSELITFYMKFFHSQSMSRALFLAVIESFFVQVGNHSIGTSAEYATLIERHKIIPFLVQKMVEFYRNDHGESLCLFLGAIRFSFIRSEDESTESDSIDELVPMLDLIETIVINGDLLHPCFQTLQKKSTDLQENKWYLAASVSLTLGACLHDAHYSRIDFMRRYGRTLLPKLVDFVFSKYDGSRAAAEALSNSTAYLFSRVMDDSLWTDEVESTHDASGIQKMVDGGRKLLQHVPFDRIAFAIQEAVKLGVTRNLLCDVDWFLFSLKNFCKDVASLNKKLSDAVARDVAPRLIQRNILPLCVGLCASLFDHPFLEVDEIKFFTGMLRNALKFLKPDSTNRLSPIASVIRNDFISNWENASKIIVLGEKVCGRYKEEFRTFRTRCNLLTQKRIKQLERGDATELKQHKDIVSRLDLLVPNMKQLVHIVKDALNENQNKTGHHEAGDGKKIVDYSARIDVLVTRLDEVKNTFKDFSERNKSKLELIDKSVE